MQLKINDKTYNIKFGVKFVRALDKAYPIEQQGLKFGMALSAKIQNYTLRISHHWLMLSTTEQLQKAHALHYRKLKHTLKSAKI